ncbi:hypothetical protein [Mesorhizobium sp.]|uniref:hypothetical protein n=1 Tax=Mesorhizobium sp. TaxID=1871066 RepID=UPI00121D1B84|nr:hypothetical protein [Mesorhizobium sp.]TIS49622.1 MAG: hypothetical protein E5W96_13865 [Mesorhizobium sp.]
MANYDIDVPRVRDSSVYNFLKEVAVLIGAQAFSIQEAGATNHTKFRMSTDDPNDGGLYWSSSDQYSVYSAGVGISNFQLNLSRKGQPDGVNDRISITNDGGLPSEDVVHDINKLVKKYFIPGPEPFVGLFNNQKAFTALIKSHQQMLLQLQGTAAQVTESIVKAHANLEAEFAARQKQLDDDFQQRALKADETLDLERKQIREKEDALANRARDLDDRDNTTARRSQHATLKSRIAERGSKFLITAETKRARLPIHVGSIAACAAIVGFLWYYASAITSLPMNASVALIIAASIKPIGLTIALLGLVAWYLRWMNRWFERYADAEFYLKQFELDIDRANWVVETALEWKEKQEKSIPDALLASISRNLFVKAEKDEDANMHPADYLASAILGHASGLTLKVPGAEVAMTGKDIRKLQKDDGP